MEVELTLYEVADLPANESASLFFAFEENFACRIVSAGGVTCPVFLPFHLLHYPSKYNSAFYNMGGTS